MIVTFSIRDSGAIGSLSLGLEILVVERSWLEDILLNWQTSVTHKNYIDNLLSTYKLHIFSAGHCVPLIRKKEVREPYI